MEIQATTWRRTSISFAIWFYLIWVVNATTQNDEEPRSLLRCNSANDHVPDSSDTEATWKLIVEDGYDTSDMVVAAIVMSRDRLPENPQSTDCSRAFNRAFEKVSTMGGGIVYAPPGEYLFKRPLILHPNVVLRGAWGSVAGSDKSVRGTVLKVTYRGMETLGHPAFIQLHSRAGLRDLTIWYPRQSIKKVIPYARTIHGVTGSLLDEITIENVNLVNSYLGIAFSDDFNCRRGFVRGLFGSPLKTGLFQGRASDVPFYTNIHFSAQFWTQSGLPGAPSMVELRNYLREEATGILMWSSDNVFASDWYVSGYGIGFHFAAKDYNKKNGSINGNMYRLKATGCRIGLLANVIGPSFIIDSFFEGSEIGVYVGKTTASGVVFNGCGFRSASDKAIECDGRNLRFQKCSFGGSLVAASTDYLSIVDSNFFGYSKTAIQLSDQTEFVTLAGNHFAHDGDFLDLNGADRKNIVLDTRDTFSETYTPFNTHGSNAKYKPSAPNLIVMGRENYPVAVDGVTDDAPAIQKALDDIYCKGGGIVLLPQISSKGYAIHSTLNVPAGVELRGNSEGLHSFNGWRNGDAREHIPGPLLQIYHGRDGTNPTITLNAGSGFKGFTVHYPEQLMSDIVPYAVTVRATGRGTYVTNTQFINSFDHVIFENSDYFLAENIMGIHIHRPFKSLESNHGRYSRNVIRSEWDDTAFDTVSSKQTALIEYSLRNSVAYEVDGCRNQQIVACFSRIVEWLGVFRNSTVRSLQFSGEALQNGVKVEGIPMGGSVELIGSSIRTDNDVPGKAVTILKAKGHPGGGDFRVIAALLTGYPDRVLQAKNVNVLLQSSIFRADTSNLLSLMKIPTHGLELKGMHHSVVRVENSFFRNALISTNIPDEAGKRLELVSNNFDSGLDYFSYPGKVQNKLYLSGSIEKQTRIAEVANIVRRAVSCQMNLKTPGNSGLELLSLDGYVRKTKAVNYRQGDWTRSISGYAPEAVGRIGSGGSKELLFNLTSWPLISDSQDDGLGNNVMLKVLYYDWSPGEFVIEHKLPSSGRWEMIKKVNLQGDNGFQISSKKRINPNFHEMVEKVPGNLFQTGTSIRLTVKEGKALFFYVYADITDASGRLTHSPLINEKFQIKRGVFKTCQWVAKKQTKKRTRRCSRFAADGRQVKDVCPEQCSGNST